MVVCRQNENATRNTVAAGTPVVDGLAKGAADGHSISVTGCVVVNKRKDSTRDRNMESCNVEPKENDDSRISRLARPHRHLAPSRAELEKQYAENRRKIAEDRKRNETTCYNAIHHPQTESKVKPRDLTVPKEFNLSSTPSRSRCTTPARSQPGTPSRSRCTSRCTTPARSICSDDGSESSARGRHGRVSSSKMLTVPQGPKLKTAQRQRSSSRSRPDENDTDSARWCANESGQRARKSTRKVAASPARSTSSQHGLVTPRPRRLLRDDESCDSISSDMAISVPCSSVRSKMGRSCDSRISRSCDSRISQLSQRSVSKHHLSTEEIEDIRIAAKREEVKAMIKQNAKRGRAAILCPQTRGARRSLSLTIPKEFNLSTPNRRLNMSASDAGSDGGDSVWSQSLRPRSVPPSPSRAWQPDLTVPEGPILRTALRAASATSRGRSGSATPRQRSLSRNRFPREQAAIERHLDLAAQAMRDRSASVELQESLSLRSSVDSVDARSEEASQAEQEKVREGPAVEELPQPPADVDWNDWVKEGANAQERALRARSVAELKLKEKFDAKESQIKHFAGLMRGGPGGQHRHRSGGRNRSNACKGKP